MSTRRASSALAALAFLVASIPATAWAHGDLSVAAVVVGGMGAIPIAAIEIVLLVLAIIYRRRSSKSGERYPRFGATLIWPPGALLLLVATGFTGLALQDRQYISSTDEWAFGYLALLLVLAVPMILAVVLALLGRSLRAPKPAEA
jgi:hypothetical protein